MPRAFNSTAIIKAQRENNEDPFLVLLTVPLETETIRIVNNTENIVSRGAAFIGCPFSLSLPNTDETTFQSASIEVDNVDDRMWQGLRQLDSSPIITIELIMASQPDTVLLSTTGLRLREAVATNTRISGTLYPDDVWRNGFPSYDFDPPQNAGLFT